MEGFELSAYDEQRVYELYRADIAPTVIVGNLPPPGPAAGIRPPVHLTRLLIEQHSIGAAGLPVRHHTQQTIFSLVEGLESYRYGLDTREVDIRVKRGGKPSAIYPVGMHYAVDIVFLAHTEGLTGHAASVEMRANDNGPAARPKPKPDKVPAATAKK